jgi:hypothetical protein
MADFRFYGINHEPAKAKTAHHIHALFNLYASK